MYTPYELFVMLRQIGLFEHLSPADLIAVEQRIIAFDQHLPLLPVFILLTAPNTALFFGMDLSDHNKYRYNLPSYPQTHWPLSLAQLQSITRGRVTFLPTDERSFPSAWPDPLNYANQLLLTRGYDERFYWVLFREDLVYNAGPYRNRLILFLSSEQRIALDRAMMFTFDDDQAHTWTPTRVHDVVQTLQKLELLNHLDNKAIVQIQSELLNRNDLHYASIVAAFPRIVYWVDAEMIYNPKQDYIDLINGLSNISRGVFMPQALSVTNSDLNHRIFEISFTFRNSSHTIPIEYLSDYINWDFLAYINQLLENSAQLGQFCFVPTYDQTAAMIFLNNQQLQQAKARNLLGQGNVVVAEQGLGRSA